MKKLYSASCALALTLPLLSACDVLLAALQEDEENLDEVELLVSVYAENEPTSVPAQITGDAASTWSNRPVMFAFNNLNTLNDLDNLVNQVEIERVSNGTTTTCDAIDKDGAVRANFGDWPGATTDYTITVHSKTETKVFGPIAITVQSAERVVSGGHGFGDQDNDAITVAGPFFQSRSVDIGAGGYTGPNFDSVLAENNARLLDFATLNVGGVFTAISPDDIQATHTFDRLVNDCGYQTTVFQEYTGALDPKVAPLTVAEVAALPDPPAGGSSLALTTPGQRFVYKTSDGKKGLVQVDTIALDTHTIGLNFSSEQ